MADFASKLRENPETAVNRSLLAYGFGYDIRIRSIERALFDYGRRRTPHHILRIVFRHRAWRNRGLGRTVRRRQELAADRFRTIRARQAIYGWMAVPPTISPRSSGARRSRTCRRSRCCWARRWRRRFVCRSRLPYASRRERSRDHAGSPPPTRCRTAESVKPWTIWVAPTSI